LEAEKELCQLETKDFRIAIVRPPMIYGPSCPGNYASLKRIALITPWFPDINNKRSVVHINNLSEMLRSIITEGESGHFFPQDDVYRSTCEMVKEIAAESGRTIKLSRLFGRLILIFGGRMTLTKKVFGSLIYRTEG